MTEPPVLSAMMCDGLGWFDDLDYKRMLLAFDEILYLLPQHLAGFRDTRGELRAVVFPGWLSQSAAVTVHHFVPNASQRELIHAAAAVDKMSEGFRASVAAIPEHERSYTWKIACADGDLTEGRDTVGLAQDQEDLAHGLLLNKFLLAADHARCVPISGKRYIHRMLSAKIRAAIHGVRARVPNTNRAGSGLGTLGTVLWLRSWSNPSSRMSSLLIGRWMRSRASSPRTANCSSSSASLPEGWSQRLKPSQANGGSSERLKSFSPLLCGRKRRRWRTRCVQPGHVSSRTTFERRPVISGGATWPCSVEPSASGCFHSPWRG